MIQCDLHDYFEAVCVRRARVRVQLRDGSSVSGIATDLKTERRVERINISTDGENRWLDLEQIQRLQAPAQGTYAAMDIQLP